VSTDATPFDPLSILAALQRAGVTAVLIGGLARVVRGADEVTTSLDICPSLLTANLTRLHDALTDLEATRPDRRTLLVNEEALRAAPVLDLSTRFGDLKIVATPAGAPRGYEALRAGATSEHLGHGLRPLVASTGDLIAMAAALGRPQELERWPMLRRILELEADPAALVPVDLPNRRRNPPALSPGDALKLARPAGRPQAPGAGPDVGR
jgi:hypothetical protein